MSRYREMDETTLDYDRPDRSRRQKRVKYRRQKSYDEESEDERDNDEVLPRWKIITVFAIIGVCFAMLFPNLFGPLFSTIFGRSSDPPQAKQPHHPFMDRGGQAPRPPGPRTGAPRMPQADAPQSSGRGGMMSWMLPIYTIGVMGFLIYTLFKMNRKKKKKRRRYDESDYSSESGSENETGVIGRKKLRSIQKRLHETEEAMAKILEQLEEVAQAAPETLNSEQLHQKYTPEQLRETEMNLQELNRLNELRTQQQLELERNGAFGNDEFVEDPEDLDQNVDDPQSSHSYSDNANQINSQRPATGREENDEEEHEPSTISNRQTVKTKSEEKDTSEERISRSGSEENSNPLPQPSTNQLRQRHKQQEQKVNNKAQSSSKKNKQKRQNERQKVDEEELIIQEVKERIHVDPEDIPVSDIEENLIGLENDIGLKKESSPEQSSPKESRASSNSIKSEAKSSPPKEVPENNEAEQQSTMFENRLFDFANSDKTTQKKANKKADDYEAPTLLEFDNGVLSKSHEEQEESVQNASTVNEAIPVDKNVYTSDAKRARRPRNKRPHAEDPNSKIDPAKMDEQRKIVEELGAQKSSEVKSEEVTEESPKENDKKSNSNKNKKQNRRNRRGQ